MEKSATLSAYCSMASSPGWQCKGLSAMHLYLMARTHRKRSFCHRWRLTQTPARSQLPARHIDRGQSETKVVVDRCFDIAHARVMGAALSGRVSYSGGANLPKRRPCQHFPIPNQMARRAASNQSIQFQNSRRSFPANPFSKSLSAPRRQNAAFSVRFSGDCFGVFQSN